MSTCAEVRPLKSLHTCCLTISRYFKTYAWTKDCKINDMYKQIEVCNCSWICRTDLRTLHSFLVHRISLSSVHELQSNEKISYSSKVPCSPPTTHHPLLWATQLLLFPSLVVEGRKIMSYLFINLKSSYTC